MEHLPSRAADRARRGRLLLAGELDNVRIEGGNDLGDQLRPASAVIATIARPRSAGAERPGNPPQLDGFRP